MVVAKPINRLLVSRGSIYEMTCQFIRSDSAGLGAKVDAKTRGSA